MSRKNNSQDEYEENYSNDRQQSTRKPKKRRILLKFLMTLCITILVLILVGAGSLLAVQRKWINEDTLAVAKDLGMSLKEGTLGELFTSLPAHTNFAILGVDDDGTRTDIMIVGTYDSTADTLSMISIPRDTMVVMPKERRDILKEKGRWTPSDGIMKANAVHSLSGKEYSVAFTIMQLEEMFGIKISYYAKLNLEAFKYVIDEMGGVEFDVPQRMYYNDPAQKLYIDLQPGLQVLNGSDAEGLIRYRKPDKDNPKSPGYARGDLQRVEVQQAFIKATIAQALRKDKIINNVSAFYTAVTTYVESNLTTADMLKYFKDARKVSMDDIHSYTIPGSISGDYYVINEAEKVKLVDEVFYSVNKKEDKKTADISSSGKNIEILNGGDIAGLAAKNKTRLEDAGFTVTSVGDYTGEKQKNTRIIVCESGMGEDIAALYKDSVITVDTTMKKGVDIRIILGTKEK